MKISNLVNKTLTFIVGVFVFFLFFTTLAQALSAGISALLLILALCGLGNLLLRKPNETTNHRS